MLIWLLADNDSYKFAAFKRIAASFASHYPDIKIDFKVMTRRSMWNRLFSHLRDSKNAPVADIIEIPHLWTAMFARLGLLAEVNSLLENFSLSRYPEFLRSGCVSHDNDNVFSIPWWMRAPALFYRPEELKKHGMSEDDLADWKSFLEGCEVMASKSRKRGYYPVIPVSSYGCAGATDVLPCVWNRGGDLFSVDGNRSTLNKEETVKGLEDYLELYLRGWMPLFGEAFFEGGPFYNEACAMALGQWPPPAGYARKDGFRPVRLPGQRKQELVMCSNLAVASGSVKYKEAGIFLKWALANDNLKEFTAGFDAFPCAKHAFEEAVESDRNAGVWRDIFAAGRIEPNTAVYPTARLLLARTLWRASLKIARQAYLKEDLIRELIISQGEIDYLLSLY